MPSKTSFFNKGIYVYNLKRFWLIGFANAFILPLFAAGLLNSISRDAHRIGITISEKDLATGILASNGSDLTILAAFFCLVSALAVFSYMHFPKSTAMIHALPVTRKTLFVTNYLSGLTLAMLPVLLYGAVLLTGLMIIGISSLQYILMLILITVVLILLLYSFAVFTGMFTGHLAAQAIFYVIFNFLALFLMGMTRYIFSGLLFGYANPVNYDTTPLCPLVYISDVYSGFARDSGDVTALPAYLLAALAFAWGAERIYSKRKMEVAGDVISLRGMKPVFKYSVAFCSSILLSNLFIDLFNLRPGFVSYLIGFLIGGFIGYFAAEMLLKKTFKVFRKIRGFIGYSAVIVILLLAVTFDLFGYETYVPEQSDVEIMYVGGGYFDELSTVALSPEEYRPNRHRFLFNDADHINNPPARLTGDFLEELRQEAGIIENPDTIQRALALHRYIADNADRLDYAMTQRASQGTGVGEVADPSRIYYVNLSIAYRLKGGRIVRRIYNLPLREDGEDPLNSLLSELFSSPEMMAIHNPILRMEAEDINYINIIVTGKAEKIANVTDLKGKADILEAIKLDVRESDPLNPVIYTREASPINVELRIYFKKKIPVSRAGKMTRIGQDNWTIVLMTDNRNVIDCLLDAGIINAGDIEIDEKY